MMGFLRQALNIPVQAIKLVTLWATLIKDWVNEINIKVNKQK